ncbi:MAG TPA: hypothetical protein VL172_13995 [Kofleriaceae bacterium]|nr:hypothetical protein [Kofleriaceae bacterium]
MHSRWMLVVMVVLAACSRKQDDEDEPKAPEPVATVAPEPQRTAAADRDLRLLLAQATAAHACDKVNGQMTALADPGSKTMTGTLWVNECRAENHGFQVTLHVGGFGWQWADQRKNKAGATFQLQQYAAFRLDASITGKVDVAYHPGNHVLTLWYLPDHLPQVDVDPHGDIDVQEQGTWSSVVGALATLFGASPEEQAGNEMEKTGGNRTQAMLAKGFAVTIDACTGVATVDMGHPPPGQLIPRRKLMDTPRRGRIEPGGLLLLGPHAPGKRFALGVAIPGSGAAAIDLVCAKDAARMAAEFADTGRVGAPAHSLLTRVVTGKARLVLKASPCPLVVATRGLGVPADVIYTWERIPEDRGKPLVRCAEAKQP